jgi:serine phosphatase RsbU (regulator of sigma subunit)
MMNAGRFLSALNLRLRAILERVEEPFVATAFYAVADTARSEVRFANAGHPVPVRLRRQDGTAERLIAPEQQGGPALGIVDGAIYPSFSCPFEKQDCIVLFTDGLYEAESPDGQAYGLKALIASLERCARLPAQELFNEVLAEIGRFAARPDFDDDVCLVAMEQTDS